MDGLMRERQAIQRLALRPLGQTPRLDRIFAGQVGSAGAEAYVVALPVFASPQALQDASGNLLMMLGVDPLDGGTALG